MIYHSHEGGKMNVEIKVTIHDVPDHVAGKPGYYLASEDGRFFGWFKPENKAEAEKEADRLGLIIGVVE